MVYLGLGSNSIDKEQMLQRARIWMSCLLGVVEARSSIYLTDPWGYDDQPTFINQVVAVSTKLSLLDLHQACLDIEAILGKHKTSKYGPRNIDIDILVYEKVVHSSVDLQIPHPRLHLRNFVLIPLAEIAPGLIIPTENQSVEALLKQCKDQGKVTPLAE